jgi:hypothetical protein
VESGYDRTIDFLKKRDFPWKAGAFDRNIDVLGKVAQCGGGPAESDTELIFHATLSNSYSTF